MRIGPQSADSLHHSIVIPGTAHPGAIAVVGVPEVSVCCGSTRSPFAPLARRDGGVGGPHREGGVAEVRQQGYGQAHVRHG